MFRASSEIAVAIRVASVPENPIAAASRRPFCLASTRSASAAIRIRPSSSTAPALPHPVEEGQPFLEVERGVDPLEAQSELHDGERDVWPDPHDDRVGSPELRGNRDAVEGPGTERVDHVQPADVEDHPARPELPDLLDQVILE